MSYTTSLKKEEAARVCSSLVASSNIKFCGLDWEEVGLYLVLTCTQEELGNTPPALLPTRKHRAGPSPSITTEEVLGPLTRDKSKSKFNPPARHPTPGEERGLIKLMLQKAIHTAMSNHYYKFEGTIHKQVDGGPIGDVLAQAGTRLYMVWWDSEFSPNHHQDEPQSIEKICDDLNLKTGILPLGSTWDRNREEVYIKPQDQITQEEADPEMLGL